MKESMYKQEKKIKDQVEYIKDMKVELDELSLYKKNCSVELLDLN